MTKSKKLLSILAAVLLMASMTFTTVFAAFPEVTDVIWLTTGQTYARAGLTTETQGEGYFWGVNDKNSAYNVELIPRVRKNTINVWHNLDGVIMGKGGTADFSRVHGFSGKPYVHWSLELNPVGISTYGCLAKARVGNRELTAGEKK